MIHNHEVPGSIPGLATLKIRHLGGSTPGCFFSWWNHSEIIAALILPLTAFNLPFLILWIFKKSDYNRLIRYFETISTITSFRISNTTRTIKFCLFGCFFLLFLEADLIFLFLFIIFALKNYDSQMLGLLGAISEH